MNQPVFLDAKSVLVSTPKGLKRLDVPFLVIVISEIDQLQVGEKVLVFLVGFNQKDNLLYYINQKYYQYFLFVIIDKRLDEKPQK